MSGLRAWVGLLSTLGSIALVVAAALNFDDTATFVKILALLVVFALWDITDEIRAVRKAVER